MSSTTSGPSRTCPSASGAPPTNRVASRRRSPSPWGARASAFRDPQVHAYVADGDASVRFCVDHLGFVGTFRTPETGPPAHVEVHLGGLVLGFADLQATRDMHGPTVDDGPPRREVAFWVDDVDAAFAKLVDAGAAPLNAPHDVIGRLRAAWVADPVGGPVLIVQDLASTGQTCHPAPCDCQALPTR